MKVALLNPIPQRRGIVNKDISGGFGTTTAGVGGGILMMIIAVVWFVVAFRNGWIFYYPPILFIVGLIAVSLGIAVATDLLALRRSRVRPA